MNDVPGFKSNPRESGISHRSIFDLDQYNFEYHHTDNGATAKDNCQYKNPSLEHDHEDKECSSSFECESTERETCEEEDSLNSERFRCSTCVVEFEDRGDLNEHLRSNLHVYNLRLKINSEGLFDYIPVEEYEFEELCSLLNTSSNDKIGILIESLENLSLDDSRHGKKKERGVKKTYRNTPFIQFNIEALQPDGRCRPDAEISPPSGECLYIYTELLLYGDEDIQCMEHRGHELERRLSNLITTGDPFSGFANSNLSRFWLIILYRAGYFSLGVIEARTGRVVASKSVQRYTVRRKQGGSQGGKDKKGAWAKSAGAQLRRHNEQLLREDIGKSFNVIMPLIEHCSLIFISCSPTLKGDILRKKDGDLGYLSAYDRRIRSIPFTTYRPTTREVLRCYRELSKVRYSAPKTRGEESLDNIMIKEITFEDLKNAVIRATQPERVDMSKHRPRVDDSDYIVKNSVTAKALKYVALDNVSSLKKVMELELQPKEIMELSNGGGCELKPNKLVLAEYEKLNGITLLHLASRKGSLKCLEALLSAGSNPSTKDHSNRTPFDVAKNRKVRQVFLAFRRNNPDMWNWDTTNIPSVPLHDKSVSPDASSKDENIKKAHPSRRRPKKQKPRTSSSDTHSHSRPSQDPPDFNAKYQDEDMATKSPTSWHLEGSINILDTLDEQQARQYLRRKALLAAMKRLGT